MARPRRLSPRYPTNQTARIRTQDGIAHTFPARDISSGGLFLSTAEPLEIFSDVRIMLTLPGGADVELPARVVHIVSTAKAESVGIPAGMGLQFDALTDDHRAAITALLAAAQAEDRRPRVPRRLPAAVDSPPADPMMAYVLAAVDGDKAPEQLATELSLELDFAERIIGQLVDAGLLEQVAAASAPPQTRNVNPSTAVASSGATPVKESGSNDREPARILQSDLIADVKQRLAAMSGQDHYAVLGLDQTADFKAIKQAFFEFSKRFHPDVYFGRAGGDEIRKLEALFGRVSEAYAVLSRRTSRAEYDEYLGRQARLSSARPGPDETLTVSMEPPRLHDRPAPAVPPAKPQAKPQAKSPVKPGARVQPPRPARGGTQEQRRARQMQAANNLRRTLSGGRSPVRAPAPTESLPDRCLAEARSAFEDGRTDDAMQSLRLLGAMDLGDNIKAQADEIQAKIYRSLAFEFEKKALYEEKHQKWRSAASTWRKVCLGRPEDSHAFQRAARASQEAGEDLHVAAKLAQRAVALAPDDANAHRVLGHIWLAAGMNENARRSLERAVALSHPDSKTTRILRDLRRVV